MDNNIFEQPKPMVLDQLDIHPAIIPPESDIIKDLGCDSLDIVDMLMSVEEEFGVTVGDKDVSEMRTMADVVNFIDNKLAE